VLEGGVFLEFLHDVDEFLLGVYPAFVLSVVQFAEACDYFVEAVDGEVVLGGGSVTSAICLVNAPC
jgi:hypothetical protein